MRFLTLFHHKTQNITFREERIIHFLHPSLGAWGARERAKKKTDDPLSTVESSDLGHARTSECVNYHCIVSIVFTKKQVIKKEHLTKIIEFIL